MTETETIRNYILHVEVTKTMRNYDIIFLT